MLAKDERVGYNNSLWLRRMNAVHTASAKSKKESLEDLTSFRWGQRDWLVKGIFTRQLMSEAKALRWGIIELI